MGKLFDYNNIIMHWLSKFADLIIISILWLVLSMTVVGFGPACTAAYYAVAKSVRRNRGGVFQEFWSSLKENFWKSMFLGLLVSLFAVSLFIFDFADIANLIVHGKFLSTGSLIFSLLKTLLLLFLTLYLFPIQSRFQMKSVQIFYTAALASVYNIGHTLLMLLLFVLAGTMVVAFPYLSIIVPGLFFWGISFPMESVLLRLMPKEDTIIDEEKDQWYLEK